MEELSLILRQEILSYLTVSGFLRMAQVNRKFNRLVSTIPWDVPVRINDHQLISHLMATYQFQKFIINTQEIPLSSLSLLKNAKYIDLSILENIQNETIEILAGCQGLYIPNTTKMSIYYPFKGERNYISCICLDVH